MSGQTPPTTPFPGTSSPVQVPAPAMGAFTDEGPLHFTARALEARLKLVFPPNYFDFQWLDGKLDKTQWGRLTRRPPTVALGWAGVTPDADVADVFHGNSHWFVGLVTKNAGGPQARLLGDKLSPGILSMVRIATIALNGFVIDPPDTPWAATGSVKLTSVSAMAPDDWAAEDYSLAGIEAAVEYDELLPPGLDTKDRFDSLQIDWTFQPPYGTWTDTIQIGS